MPPSSVHPTSKTWAATSHETPSVVWHSIEVGPSHGVKLSASNSERCSLSPSAYGVSRLIQSDQPGGGGAPIAAIKLPASTDTFAVALVATTLASSGATKESKRNLSASGASTFSTLLMPVSWYDEVTAIATTPHRATALPRGVSKVLARRASLPSSGVASDENTMLAPPPRPPPALVGGVVPPPRVRATNLRANP